jgi:type VI secretion system protein VasD
LRGGREGRGIRLETGEVAVTVASGKLWPAILLILSGALVAGCSKPPPPPPPTMVELSFVASPDVNPDPGGRASPIIVRYYQLAGTGAFEKGDYFQIHNKEAAVLGADLLAQEEVQLLPATTQKTTFEAKKDTKFLGVIASYRDINHAVWRADVPIPPNKTTKLKVQLDKLTLSIVPDTTK